MNIRYILVILFITVIGFYGYSGEKAEILDISDCIGLAIQNNPSLRSSYLAVEGSIEKLNEARAQYFPSLSMSASARKSSSGSDDDDGIFNSYSAGISTRYTIYQGGNIRNQNEIAGMNIKTSEYSYDSELQDLIYSIKDAYYSLLQAKHSQIAAEKNVERSETYLDLAKTKLEAGVAIISDVLKIEVELSDARLNLINAENSYRNAKALLNNLLGMPPGEDIEIVDNLEDISYADTGSYEELLETAVKNRPEIKRLENQIEIQKTMIKMSQADYLPSLSFDAGYNYGGSRISDMEDSWNFGFGLSMSIFSGGATKSAVLQEKIALKDLAYQKEELLNQIRLSLFQAFNDFNRQRDVIENSRIYLQNARMSLDIAREGYKEGTHSIIELVDAQTSLVSAENRYIQSLADYRISFANLEKVLGRELGQ